MFLTPSNASGGGDMVYAITTSGAGDEQKITFSTPFTLGKWTHIALT